MFRMNGMPRAQGCAGAAQHIHVSLGTRLPRQLLLHCSTSCILAVVPRTVLELTTRPSFRLTAVHPIETTDL